MTDPDPIDTHVGDIVREARMASGLSMQGLGSRLGVSYQQVQKYERGANRISASMLYRIASELDRSVSDFFPSSQEDPKIAPRVKAEDLRTSMALGRIEDARVRQKLRMLIAALADTAD